MWGTLVNDIKTRFQIFLDIVSLTRYFQIFLDIVSEQDFRVLDFGFWILDFENFSDFNFEFLNFEF